MFEHPREKKNMAVMDGLYGDLGIQGYPGLGLSVEARGVGSEQLVTRITAMQPAIDAGPLRALMAVEAGLLGIGYGVESLSDSEVKHLWKRFDVHALRNAAIFEAHGLAALSLQTPGEFVDHDRQQEVAKLLRLHYPITPDRQLNIENTVGNLGPYLEDIEFVTAGLFVNALFDLIGDDVRRFDRLSIVLGVDTDFATEQTQSSVWQICRNHTVTDWLMMTDAASYVKWQS